MRSFEVPERLVKLEESSDGEVLYPPEGLKIPGKIVLAVKQRSQCMVASLVLDYFGNKQIAPKAVTYLWSPAQQK